MVIEIKPVVINESTELPQLLRTARLTAGLSADQLAALLGCSAGSVRAREAGARNTLFMDAVMTLAVCGYRLTLEPNVGTPA